jgi:uncharacterized protein YukE
MSMMGMDPDQIENIGRQVQHQAQAVQQVMTAVDGLISQAEQAWKGQDADQFRDKWNSSFKTVLNNLHTELDQFGLHAIQEAGQQRSASGS